MFISDIDRNQKQAAKTALVYLLISLFLVLFGAVYERFSHDVYSYYMLYAFCFPLVGGTLVFGLLSFTKLTAFPNAVSRNLYHSGIATLTAGSIVLGVLDIYGTTNILTGYYWKIGTGLTLEGIVVCAAHWLLLKKRSQDA